MYTTVCCSWWGAKVTVGQGEVRALMKMRSPLLPSPFKSRSLHIGPLTLIACASRISSTRWMRVAFACSTLGRQWRRHGGGTGFTSPPAPQEVPAPVGHRREGRQFTPHSSG